MKKQNLIKKIIIMLITTLIFTTQTIKADEIDLDPHIKKLSILTEKLNHIIECINKELKETKDFQIKQWEKGKKQNVKNLKIVQNKLTGFFSDFPSNQQEDK
tara:strand:- start:196 stop:501 length:306 start_codon:yes stop_codon:yes gene_type:complete